MSFSFSGHYGFGKYANYGNNSASYRNYYGLNVKYAKEFEDIYLINNVVHILGDDEKSARTQRRIFHSTQNLSTKKSSSSNAKVNGNDNDAGIKDRTMLTTDDIIALNEIYVKEYDGVVGIGTFCKLLKGEELTRRSARGRLLLPPDFRKRAYDSKGALDLIYNLIVTVFGFLTKPNSTLLEGSPLKLSFTSMPDVSINYVCECCNDGVKGLIKLPSELSKWKAHKKDCQIEKNKIIYDPNWFAYLTVFKFIWGCLFEPIWFAIIFSLIWYFKGSFGELKVFSVWAFFPTAFCFLLGYLIRALLSSKINNGRYHIWAVIIMLGIMYFSIYEPYLQYLLVYFIGLNIVIQNTTPAYLNMSEGKKAQEAISNMNMSDLKTYSRSNNGFEYKEYS